MKEHNLEYTALGTIKPHSIREAAKFITDNTAISVIVEHYGENIAKLKDWHIDNLKQAYCNELVSKFHQEEIACLEAETIRVNTGEINAEECEFWGDKEEFIAWNTQHNNRRELKTRLRIINKVYCTNLQGAYFTIYTPKLSYK